MELHFNELSVFPAASNESEARASVEKLIKTFTAGNRKYNVDKIRFASDWSEIELAARFSLADCVRAMNNVPSLRTPLKLFLKARKYPFLDKAKDDEYLKYEYKFSAHEIEIIEKEPLGIAAAYVSKGLSLSISAHAIWERNLFSLTLLPDDKEVEVPNVFSPECWTNEQIEKFCARPFAFTLEYLQALFPNYIFEDKAINDINTIIAKKEIDLFRRLIRLLENIIKETTEGRLGSAEVLSYDLSGKKSKRLTLEHRIVYTYSDEQITIFQCLGHY